MLILFISILHSDLKSLSFVFFLTSFSLSLFYSSTSLSLCLRHSFFPISSFSFFYFPVASTASLHVTFLSTSPKSLLCHLHFFTPHLLKTFHFILLTFIRAPPRSKILHVLVFIKCLFYYFNPLLVTIRAKYLTSFPSKIFPSAFKLYFITF